MFSVRTPVDALIRRANSVYFRQPGERFRLIQRQQRTHCAPAGRLVGDYGIHLRQGRQDGFEAGFIDQSDVHQDAPLRVRDEQRSVEYARLDAEQAGTIEEPAPEVLTKYFEDNKALFRAPEYRKIAFVAATPADLAKTIVVLNAPSSDRKAKKCV